MKPWLVVIIAAFYLVGFWTLGQSVWGVWQATRPAGWPTAPATVTHAQLVEGEHYRVDVRYTYSVGGVEYEGARVAFGYDGGANREAHAALFQKIRDAKTIAARYDPENPAESCLSHGVHSSVGMAVWFAGAWLLFTVGFTSVMLLFTRRDTVLIDNIVVE